MRPARRKRQSASEGDPQVQAAILEAIDKQLREDNPPEVRLTLQRLVEGGMTEREARLYIAMALLFEMNEIVRTKAPFDEARYVASLKRLPKF